MRTNENTAGMVCIAVASMAVAVWWWTDPAMASSDPFSPILAKASTASTELQKILQTVGVLGFIAVCAFAIFSRGKFPWGWAAAIAGGFLLVGLAPTLISWLMEVSSSSSSSSLLLPEPSMLAVSVTATWA